MSSVYELLDVLQTVPSQWIYELADELEVHYENEDDVALVLHGVGDAIIDNELVGSTLLELRRRLEKEELERELELFNQSLTTHHARLIANAQNSQSTY